MAAVRSESASNSGNGSDSDSDSSDPQIQVVRAELVRGHRPVVVSDVPVYIALKDKEGKLWEAKGEQKGVRYRWSRGPLIKPCVFHPHKMSLIRDVAKTYQCYCSRECFLRGWHGLPQSMWGHRADHELEEPLAQWEEVCQDRHYCPSQTDIDRPLRLDVIPVMKNGQDVPERAMSLTTGTVIPTPKEARVRRMISNGGQFNAEWLSQQFKVMNWNILADLYATESVYPYCEKWALSWTWRKHLIIKELKSMTADIITLQEVQKDAFEEWFKPELAADYEGIFQPKKREAIFHRGKYTSEGCATFYKKSRFRRVGKDVIDYDKMTQEQVKIYKEEAIPRKHMARLSKGNIALAVVLEDTQIKAVNTPGGPNGGCCLTVVNTHILCDPGSADVKLWQAWLLMRGVSAISSTRNMPMLICGDFNSTPDSAVYEFMRSRTVNPNHEDLRADPCGLFKSIPLDHPQTISTAYETCNGQEAQYTNYTEDFKGTLDYIWFSNNSLAVLAVSQVDDESQLTQETALPSSTRPSDHVSLVATFMFRGNPEPDTLARPQPGAGRAGGLPAQLATAVAAGGPNPYHMAGAAQGPVANPWMTTQGDLYSAAASAAYMNYMG